MAKRAAAIEHVEGELAEVPFVWNRRPLPPGSSVEVRIKDAAGNVTNVDLPWNGTAFTATNDMEIGARFKYEFVITEPGKAPVLEDKDRSGKKFEGIVKEADPTSPSPATPFKDVRSRMKAQVHRIIESARSPDEVRTLDELFDQMRDELDAMGITANQMPLILELVSEEFRDNKNIPFPIRSRFPKTNPPANFNEVAVRLAKGADIFRKGVFTNLKGNKDAREHFKIGAGVNFNASNPLGNSHANHVFGMVCGRRDLLPLMPHLKQAFASVVNVPARNQVADKRRQANLAGVVTALAPEQKERLFHPAIRAKLQQFVEESAIVGIGLGVGGPVGAIVAYLGKFAAEGLLNFRIGDIGAMKGKDLAARLFRFDAFKNWVKKKETAGTILKNGLSNWGKRSAPLLSVKNAGEDYPDEAEAEGDKDTEFINAACGKAMGGST